MEFNVDYDTDINLGYDWLQAHYLGFLYDTDQPASVQSAAAGQVGVCLDLTLVQQVVPALPLSVADLHALLCSACLHPVTMLGRPLQLTPATRRPAMVASLISTVEAAWTAYTLACLADACNTLANCTELLVSHIALAV